MQIVDCARYLGAFLGPKSAHVAWRSPIAKWSNRTAMISAGAPCGVLVTLYNTRALTTLSYVAQFSLPPDRIYPRERALLGRLLHFPGNVLASSDVFSLRRWGSHDINSLLAMSVAILMRAALVTLTTWPSMLELLKANDAEHLNVVKGVVKSRFKPKHWDTASIAELLRDVSLGFPDSVRFRAAGQLALSAFRRERSTSKRFPKGIQTVFYNIFLDTLFFDSISSSLRRGFVFWILEFHCRPPLTSSHFAGPSELIHITLFSRSSGPGPTAGPRRIACMSLIRSSASSDAQAAKTNCSII